jgi:hypothetical protein
LAGRRRVDDIIYIDSTIETLAALVVNPHRDALPASAGDGTAHVGRARSRCDPHHAVDTEECRRALCWCERAGRSSEDVVDELHRVLATTRVTVTGRRQDRIVSTRPASPGNGGLDGRASIALRHACLTVTRTAQREPAVHRTRASPQHRPRPRRGPWRTPTDLAVSAPCRSRPMLDRTSTKVVSLPRGRLSRRPPMCAMRCTYRLTSIALGRRLRALSRARPRPTPVPVAQPCKGSHPSRNVAMRRRARLAEIAAQPSAIGDGSQMSADAEHGRREAEAAAAVERPAMPQPSPWAPRIHAYPIVNLL